MSDLDCLRLNIVIPSVNGNNVAGMLAMNHNYNYHLIQHGNLCTRG